MLTVLALVALLFLVITLAGYMSGKGGLLGFIVWWEMVKVVGVILESLLQALADANK